MFRKTYLPEVITRIVAWMVFLFVIGSVTLVQEVDRVGAAAGESQAARASTVDAVPGGPGFVSINAAAFTPTHYNDQFYFSGFALTTPNAYGSEFFAPLTIPNGATITKFVVYFYNNSYQDFSIQLLRVPLESNTGESMATLQLSGGANYYRYDATTDIYTPLVDQQSYSYVIGVYLPGDEDIRLANVRVDYAFTSQLPLVNK